MTREAQPAHRGTPERFRCSVLLRIGHRNLWAAPPDLGFLSRSLEHTRALLGGNDDDLRLRKLDQLPHEGPPFAASTPAVLGLHAQSFRLGCCARSLLNRPIGSRLRGAPAPSIESSCAPRRFARISAPQFLCCFSTKEWRRHRPMGWGWLRAARGEPVDPAPREGTTEG
jgi:hypothetical protein